jgi:hypothetical protein
MNDDLLKLQLKRIFTSRAGFLAIATLVSFAAAAVALQESSPQSSAAVYRGELMEDMANPAIAPTETIASIFDLPEKYRKKLLAPLTDLQKKPTLQERLARMERDRRDRSFLSPYWNNLGGLTRFNYHNLFPSQGLGLGGETALAGQTREKTEDKPARDRNAQTSASTHTETALLAQRNRPLNLTPTDVIALALAAEPEVKQTYLEWVAQHRDRATVESPSSSKAARESEPRWRTTTFFELGENLTIEIPTEAEINALPLNTTESKQVVSINPATVTTEQLIEDIQRLNFHANLENTVNNAIFAYRNLWIHQERAKIEQRALTTAKAIVERDKNLIETGKIKQSDRATGQEWVAYLEARLNEANKAADRAKGDLLNILQLDPNLPVAAIENLEIAVPEMNGEALQKFMFANRPDYLLSRLKVERAKLAFVRAENDRQLLDLEAHSGDNLEQKENQKAKTKTLEPESERSRIAAIEAQNNITNLEETLIFELNARLEDIAQTWQEMEVAKQARWLAERNLEIELGQHTFGHTDLLTLAQWQNECIKARNAELNAKVNYLNAIAQLDHAIGNTLNTWKIEFKI